MTADDLKREVALGENQKDDAKKEVASPENKPDDPKKEIKLAEYNEVVSQFRKLTDIRFQLLTYLPLGTAFAAAFVSKDKDLVNQPVISAFGFLVTLCIATYNKRNDQFYDELIARAAELERELDIEHGSFRYRPKPWLKYGCVPVEHRWPIGLIYAAAASLWAYLFVDALDKDQFLLQMLPRWREWLSHQLMWLPPRLIWLQPELTSLRLTVPAVTIVCHLGLRCIGPMVTIAGWRKLRSIEEDRNKEQRTQVKNLMKQLLEVNDPDAQDKLVEMIAIQPILDTNGDKAERRVKYYWKKELEQKRDPRADPRSASALLAGVLDLPARWIEDIYTGRR